MGLSIENIWKPERFSFLKKLDKDEGLLNFLFLEVDISFYLGEPIMRILNTSIYNEFFDLVSSAQEKIKLCSPFIKNEIVYQIYENISTSCSISVITNVNLMNFCKKSSDINALRTILMNGDTVYNYQRLHAKIYIFDDQQAIITSANLTHSGFKRNFEYGVLIDDIRMVENVCKDYLKLCNSELSGILRMEHIQEIENIIKSIPSPPDIIMPGLTLNNEEGMDDFFDKDIAAIINNLSGWKKALFTALAFFIEPQIFTTKDFVSILPYLRNQYPDNNNIEAKIRQQLQELRDLGLIKFEGNGVYKKLWT